MNEKLRQLAKEAGFMPDNFISRWDQEFQKLFELIVRECADQCTTEGPFVAEVVWGKQFHKKILEHLGVEE